MKIEKVVTTTTVYISSVHEAIQTTDADLAVVIEWADANPIVWDVVIGVRSKAFGRNSSHYLGYLQKSNAPAAVLDRACAFKIEVDRKDDFFGWKARFTMAHYNDKGFRSGVFRQFDGEYDRGCSTCDYTPATREDVITRFMLWCDSSACRYETREIRIDKECVRKLSKMEVV